MNLDASHSPVFLIFPPDITSPEYQSIDLTATTFESQNFLQKLVTKKMKILGAIQIVFGIMTFSFGIIFLFTLVKPYPRYPFIFLSGYPFWGSVLFIMSGAFLIALKRKTTDSLIKATRVMNFLSAMGAIAGIILLVFGFLLDGDYICGYSEEDARCRDITALFIGILIMLTIFSTLELFISLIFSIWGCHFEEFECSSC